LLELYLDLLMEHVHVGRGSYGDKEVFHAYGRHVPVPHLENFHPAASVVNTPAVLLMDNCGVHVGANTMVLFAENDVTVITFPPHISGIFQMLDLVLFRRSL
jgi:hypothetical protein